MMETPATLVSAIRLRSIGVFFGAIAAMLIAAEIATRYVVIPASRIERRIDRELGAAPNAKGSRSVLLVGNSLMLFALREQSVRRLVPEPWRAVRVTVEQTSYLDWKYGLRELWRRGAAPAVLAVMLDASQLTGDMTRADYSALRIIGSEDVIPFGRDAGMHPTDISRLLLSHASALYGFRSESRKVLLGRLMPGMQALGGRLIPRPLGTPDTLKTRRVAAARLRSLDSLARSHGSRLVFLLPPRLGDQSELRAVGAAAQDVRVPLIGPGTARAYTSQEFIDGYHLSDAGAERYESEISRGLTALLLAGAR